MRRLSLTGLMLILLIALNILSYASNNKQHQQILQLSKQVLTALKTQNIQKLASYVHPTKGVRFTFKTTISHQDQQFQRAQLIKAYKSQKKLLWGYQDGTGKPIKYTFKQYLSKVVYHHDYLHAPKIGYNQILHRSNNIDNSKQYYPRAIMVQYYFPGFKKQYGGLDWSGLRLFFTQYKNHWYLVGVVNDRWAI